MTAMYSWLSWQLSPAKTKLKKQRWPGPVDGLIVTSRQIHQEKRLERSVLCRGSSPEGLNEAVLSVPKTAAPPPVFSSNETVLFSSEK
jgi:hypothetical protein